MSLDWTSVSPMEWLTRKGSRWHSMESLRFVSLYSYVLSYYSFYRSGLRIRKLKRDSIHVECIRECSTGRLSQLFLSLWYILFNVYNDRDEAREIHNERWEKETQLLKEHHEEIMKKNAPQGVTISTSRSEWEIDKVKSRKETIDNVEPFMLQWRSNVRHFPLSQLWYNTIRMTIMRMLYQLWAIDFCLDLLFKLLFYRQCVIFFSSKIMTGTAMTLSITCLTLNELPIFVM